MNRQIDIEQIYVFQLQTVCTEDIGQFFTTMSKYEVLDEVF